MPSERPKEKKKEEEERNAARDWLADLFIYYLYSSQKQDSGGQIP